MTALAPEVVRRFEADPALFVDQIRMGDADAEAMLLSTLGKMTWPLCRQRRIEYQAEDIAQSAALKAWSFICEGRLTQPQFAFTFLFQVAANEADTYLRRARTRRLDRAVPLDAAHHLRQHGPDPEQAAMTIETVAGLDRALQVLSPCERQAVVDHHLHGRTHEEIAAAVGAPYCTQKVRAHRGKLKLRAVLEGKPLTYYMDRPAVPKGDSHGRAH